MLLWKKEKEKKCSFNVLGERTQKEKKKEKKCLFVADNKRKKKKAKKKKSDMLTIITRLQC